jgi:hypothetical protein
VVPDLELRTHPPFAATSLRARGAGVCPWSRRALAWDEERAPSPAPPLAVSMRGESILLTDDTWTTGASVQSAAAALKTAGAGAVGALVIGRHVNAGYGDHAKRLQALPRPFGWERCALHQ